MTKAVEQGVIKAIIVDDNPGDIELLKQAIETIEDSSLQLVGEALSADECIDLVDKEEPDLVFLDIDMPAVSGIEIAKMLMNYEKPPLVAFITGRKDFAIKAFELDAIDYVVKPYQKERLTQTIEKARKFMKEKPDTSNIHSMLEELVEERLSSSSAKLAVKDYKERTIRFLNYKDIVFIERKDRRVVIYTEKEEFPTYYTIDKLTHKLTEKYGFHKVNQGAIVNIDFVEHMIPNGDGTYDLLLSVRKSNVLGVSRSFSKSLLASLSL